MAVCWALWWQMGHGGGETHDTKVQALFTTLRRGGDSSTPASGEGCHPLWCEPGKARGLEGRKLTPLLCPHSTTNTDSKPVTYQARL